jgi:beta-glucosidase/6-phospho-beta-glucosidase/beta-galactosidase
MHSPDPEKPAVRQLGGARSVRLTEPHRSLKMKAGSATICAMTTARSNIFQSFWIAGFESACHINEHGHRLDMIAATQHDRFVDEDYARLQPFGMRTVRDTVRWHLVERRAGLYDFSSFQPQINAANAHGIQVIWDLCHYGWPEDLDLLSTDFVDRFARFCRVVCSHLRNCCNGPLLVTPINEISFLAWASGEAGWFAPFGTGRAAEIKRQLIRAMISGIEAIWQVDPRARIVSVEPLVNVVPPLGAADTNGAAAAYHEAQFEAWDMLAGIREPELGGRPRYLDVMGVNFYHDNQWEHPGGKKIHWHIQPRDNRWVPFSRLIGKTFERYRRPIFVGETSHVGSGRAEWLREMTDEVCLALVSGIPVEAVCLYPILDRFEWNDPTHWHNSGLWDYDLAPNGVYRRVLNAPYAAELRRSQAKVEATFDRLARAVSQGATA